MLPRGFRRLRRWSVARLLVTIITLGLLWDAFYLGFVGHTPRRVPQAQSAVERVFIASIHWNNEAILRSHWIQGVLDLVRHLGPANVFVAVLESGSWDDSKTALRELDAELAKMNVARSIVLENSTHADEMARTRWSDDVGWIETPRGRRELRRIPYLANLRNRVMAKMTEYSDAKGMRFDKVLWINDVVFTTEDVLTLLDTNSGDYAAACSLDFSKPPRYYDTFALRDIAGSKTVIQTWPYFFSGPSQRTLVANDEAVPVRSCWNGMVAMDTEPFYATHPLAFRGVSDRLALLHLEGSECCLIHADNRLSETKGVYLNPNVRVAYNPAAYHAVNAFVTWPSLFERIRGVWMARLNTVPAKLRYAVEHVVVQRRVNQREEVEPGVFCLVNEMQVLVENGWKHL